MEAEDGTRLSAVGLELFLVFSSWTAKPGGSGGDALLLKDWERFFLELSSKNSMTKAWLGSALPRLDEDCDSGGEEAGVSLGSGEVKR